MKTKKVLYTTLAVLSLATAGYAPVYADGTSPSTSPVAQDVQEVKLDITVTRDAQNRIVFQIKPQGNVDLGKSFSLEKIRASYLDGDTAILATDHQSMGFSKNSAGVYEKVWELRLSGMEKDPYMLDNYSKSRAGNYRFTIDEVVEQKDTGKKFRMVGSVDFGMNDQYEYAPVTKTETKVIERTESVPFTSTKESDPSLEKGKTRVQTSGVNGEKTVKVRQTLVNGKVTLEEVLEEKVTKEPVAEVIAEGTKEASSNSNSSTQSTSSSSSNASNSNSSTQSTSSSSSNASSSSSSTQSTSSSSSSSSSKQTTSSSSKSNSGRDNNTNQQSSSASSSVDKQDNKGTSSSSIVKTPAVIKEKENNAKQTKKSLPNTGEQLSLLAVAGGLLLAVLAFVIGKKNKIEK